MKTAFAVPLLFFCFGLMFSESLARPRITYVQPAFGKAGSSVTITGSGFSADTSGNIVYFGPVRATVTAASVTSLTVIVPFGSAFDFVTVTTGGRSGSSPVPYCTVFDGPGGISPFSFESRVGISAGAMLRMGTVADLDGDGKPDIVCSNDMNAVSIFRNTSVPGSLSSSSFAGRVDVPVGSRPYKVAYGDFDGDGNLDLATANNSSYSVTILRNTSSPGSMAFTRQDFSVMAVPQYLAVADIDQDGKPDLIVSGSDNGLSVFRNTSEGSSIVFGERIDLDMRSCAIAIADLDGDGNPDILVAGNPSNQSGYLTVFRNTSMPGNVTFDQKQVFAVGPFARGIAAGDLDGDGAPDVVITSGADFLAHPKAVSIFRNTSQQGSVQLAPRIDLASVDSTAWDVSLADLDGDGKPDIAVPYSGIPKGVACVYRNLSSPGNISFDGKVSFADGSGGYGINVADFDLDGRPDIVLHDYLGFGISVFRNTGSPQGPPVSVMMPDTIAGIGQTIEIPVYVSDLSGRGILAYQFTLRFNSPDSILAALSEVATTGTLSGASGWNVLANANTPNQLTLGGYGALPLSGSGALVKLRFKVIRRYPADTSCTLRLSGLVLNKDTSGYLATNGRITIRNVVCGDADEDGITQAYDAAVVLREAVGPVAGPPGPLTAQGRLNADIDLNGRVQPYDAALILRHTIELPMPAGVSSCFGGNGTGDTTRTDSVGFAISLLGVERGSDLTSAFLALTGPTPDAGVLALSLVVNLPNDVSGSGTLTVSSLPDGYVYLLNRVQNGRFHLGIINPHGISANDIKLTLAASNAGSLNTVWFGSILLNTAPHADVVLNGLTTGIVTAAASPRSFNLIGAYPNPFNPSTRIVFDVPENANVILEVYNALGMKVRSLLNQEVHPGRHEITWDGLNESGRAVSTGQYFCRMRTGSFTRVIRLMSLK